MQIRFSKLGGALVGLAIGALAITTTVTTVPPRPDPAADAALIVPAAGPTPVDAGQPLVPYIVANADSGTVAGHDPWLTAAPLDRYLRGDQAALSPQARRGFRTFSDLGCVACHQGRHLGGNMFQVMGIFGDYFADHGTGRAADLGRFNQTGDPADRHVFLVPSLRNVATTAPYFHDGSVATLGEAIRLMARYQLGREVTERQVADVAAFLHALTGGGR